MPDTTDPAASALDGIRATAMTGDQVAAYLEHVRALIKTSQSKPGDTETERVIVAELFPGFVAAAEAALKLADDWDAESDYLDGLADRGDGDEEGRPVMAGQAIAYHDAAVDLREAIAAALAGKEAGDGG